MNKIKIILISTIILSFVGCGLMYSIVGSGDVIKEDREIDINFTGVKITNHGNLFIKIGDQVKLTIEGDDNIISLISAKVSDNRLIIRSDKKLRRGYKSRKGIKYYLTVKKGQLNYLSATSHGDISIPELTGDMVKVILTSHGDVEIGKIIAKEVKLHLTSHGDIEIEQVNADSIRSKQTSHSKVRIKSGKVKTQELYLTSHGDYLAKNLKSNNCDVTITSHGKVVVNVSELLEAKISGHGDLYYLGDAKVKFNKGKHGTIKSID